MALGYLSIRQRSLREMNEYLSKKGFSDQDVAMVVQELKDENYLNDRLFAQNYLENRKRNKPKSLYAFRYELETKGIHSKLIDELLTDYDDLELAFLALGQKIRIWKHLEASSLKKKAFGYLRYRGFSFAVIQSTWQKILDSHLDSSE
jgi:regulatory protein